MHFDRFLAISQDLAVLNAFIFIEIVCFIIETIYFGRFLRYNTMDLESARPQLTTTSCPKAGFGGFDIFIFIEIVCVILPNHAF